MRSEVQIFPDPPLFRSSGIENRKRDHGAIAQLGERLLCTQEVVGSIPSGSTTFLVALLHEDFVEKGEAFFFAL